MRLTPLTLDCPRSRTGRERDPADAGGRENWLFIGAEEAGWRSTVIYSVIASFQSRGLDPYGYLRNVLTRLPTMTHHQIPTITRATCAEEKQSDRSLAS